ncbi:unnamed protein product [Owenia fusiformis]|uniref:TIR domain-containing protein n=1 Tax=Owenia fusiformis TaxID=6347 RepID=A0A8S4NVG1_OWEFU|nr:unnamed protein product [Owenia fusiformis]
MQHTNIQFIMNTMDTLVMLFAILLIERVSPWCQHCNCTNYIPTDIQVKCSIGKFVNLTQLEDPTKYERILYSRGYLSSIPIDLCRLKNLKYIDLSWNNITTLRSNQFQCFRALVHLKMQNNAIRYLPIGVFEGLNNLQTLNLSSNDIHKIEEDVFKESFEESMTSLDISHNNLEYVPSEIMDIIFNATPLNRHRFFNLSHNHITFFEEGSQSINKYYEYLSINEEFMKLDLTFNKVTHIDINFLSPLGIKNVDSFETFWGSRYRIGVFFSILLHNNPLICDCNNFLLYKIGTETMNLLAVGQLNLPESAMIDRTGMVCRGPQEFNGTSLFNMKNEQFVCPVDGCLPKCSCIYSAHNETLTVDCSNIGLTSFPKKIPSYPGSPNITLNISGNRIAHFEERIYLSSITILDVRNNYIETIDIAAIIKLIKIRKLYLQSNHIKYLPKEITALQFNGSIGLYNNSFVCDCYSIWMTDWIKTLKNLLQEPVCINGGAKVRDYIEDELTCYINLKLAVALPLTFAAAIMLFVGLLYHYRPLIVLWWRHKVYRRAVHPQHNIDEKIFDAFVGYEKSDVNWIKHELIPLLEPKYKLCIHQRDFPVGDYIIETITESISKSQCNIMVVSAKFIESQWCLEEFAIAHKYYMAFPAEKLIMIILDDHIKQRPITNKLVKYYICCGVFIEANAADFHAKLLAEMPCRSVRDRNDEIGELDDYV